jgi:hypothetical protein
MKMIALAAAALMTAAISTEASAGSLISLGGKGSSFVNVAPKVNVLNGSNTSVLSGILSSNSILNGSKILSGNNGNGLLGLGILSGNNSNNSYGKTRRGCGCR